ncbi:hypothetical protein KFK09_007500 [Dendrobium nobile]|uniref:Uncharacterized protein n=1 Tax=Dendrobium nobile TaxID=94219 RepID=A0A8T3BS25_DENNO|nr:hypothetical protein KFK09_007500 [Dendrobium nobile]
MVKFGLERHREKVPNAHLLHILPNYSTSPTIDLISSSSLLRYSKALHFICAVLSSHSKI